MHPVRGHAWPTPAPLQWGPDTTAIARKPRCAEESFGFNSSARLYSPSASLHCHCSWYIPASRACVTGNSGSKSSAFRATELRRYPVCRTDRTRLPSHVRRRKRRVPSDRILAHFQMFHELATMRSPLGSRPPILLPALPFATRLPIALSQSRANTCGSCLGYLHCDLWYWCQ
jgi:hypothetical protein